MRAFPCDSFGHSFRKFASREPNGFNNFAKNNGMNMSANRLSNQQGAPVKIVQTPPGPFHSFSGRVIPWDSYDVINYPSAEDLRSTSHGKDYGTGSNSATIFDQKKRDEWLRRKTIPTVELESLRIFDTSARVTPQVVLFSGIEDLFAREPVNIILDSILALIIAAWLGYVIVKGQTINS